MSSCDPIEPAQLSRMLSAFKGPNAARNRALVSLGCSSGLRVTELLAIRLGDILHLDGTIKNTVTLSPQVYALARTKADAKRLKTGDKKRRTKRHTKTTPIHHSCHKYLDPWLKELTEKGYQQPSDHLFITSTGKLMTRWQVYKIIRAVAFACCVNGVIGTHSMKKTFSKQMFIHLKEAERNGENRDVMKTMMTLLGHSDYNSTLSYLKFIKDDPQKLVQEVHFAY